MSSATVKRVSCVNLGRSGLKVSRIILGTMQYGSTDWQTWALNEEAAIKQIKEAYDLGIQTFDTADTYSNGLSEIILGKAIKELELPRDEIVVMTKLFNIVAPDYGTNYLENKPPPDAPIFINQRGLSRKHIFEGIRNSLVRLQLDYVDVLQCHRFDALTPIEETMQALHDVVKAGYARYIGMSSCYAWQFHAMQNYAINNNLTPFISMQNHYNLIYREEEREMLPTLKHFGVASIPWSPLAGGLTARPLDQTTVRKETYWITNHYFSGEGTKMIISRIEDLAKKRGVTMSQISIAWILSKGGVCAPVVGVTKSNHLVDIIGALDVELTENEILYLEEPYKPRSTMGHT